MKSADFLDALRVKLHCPSDRKLAKQLGWPREEVSAYRTGRREFSERKALYVANLLNVSAGYVMAEIRAERADCTEVKRVWEAVARHLKTVQTKAAALALLGLLILGGVPQPAQADGAAAGTVYTLHAYVRRLLRRLFGKSRLNRSERPETRRTDFSDQKREIGRMRARLSHDRAPALTVTWLVSGGHRVPADRTGWLAMARRQS